MEPKKDIDTKFKHMLKEVLKERWVRWTVGIACFFLVVAYIGTKNDLNGLSATNNYTGPTEDTSTSSEDSAPPEVQETEQEKIDRITLAANTPRYKQLKKNADKYKWTKAIYTGKVVQVQEGDNITHLRIEVTKGEYNIWSDVIFVVYEGTTDIVEDDIVKVYGELQGDYEYESQAGWKIHVPRLDAEVIKVTKKSK